MGHVEYSGIQKLFNVCLKRMKRRFSEMKSLKGKQRWNDFYVGIQGSKNSSLCLSLHITNIASCTGVRGTSKYSVQKSVCLSVCLSVHRTGFESTRVEMFPLTLCGLTFRMVNFWNTFHVPIIYRVFILLLSSSDVFLFAVYLDHQSVVFHVTEASVLPYIFLGRLFETTSRKSINSMP
jgi:hypothetical protein